MPVYFYECENCAHINEEWASMSEFKDLKPPCKECAGPTHNVFRPSVCQVAFKDGPSGSWVSKGLRFQKHRQVQNEAAAKRQRDRFGDTNKLVPNYNGRETESWREAQNEATKERGVESAATYASKVQTEKKIT